MFGYPTGLGACIIKKELNPILSKRYFGGGTGIRLDLLFIGPFISRINSNHFSTSIPTLLH